MEARQNLLELCRKINDGYYDITPECAEYKALEQWITDEQIAVLMAIKGTMKVNTVPGIAKRAGISKARTAEVLQELTEIGMVNQAIIPKVNVYLYLMPLYTPGVFEFLMLNEKFVRAHPEIAYAFHGHATKSQEHHAMNTPMGAGIMRVIPVESAIPDKTEIIDKETCRYYIEKNEGHITALPCQCRRVRIMMGEGSGDTDESFCLFMGLVADMFSNLGRGKKLTKEEAYAAIEHFEEIGCVHQITTLEDGNTFAICNCQPESCLALGISQYYNTPNFSASNYVAEIDPEKCVACGQCTTTCANNAIKMGQKICAKTPYEWPVTELPDDLEWGPERWNPDYRENRKFVAECGTSPCKSECPAHIAVQGYIKLASQGKYMDALELIKKENPFPAVCGSICNRRCEDACTRGNIDDPIAIDEVKKFIAEQELNKKTRFVPKKLHTYGGKVAIIGAGPAGLSCAYYLAAEGHTDVTVFDRNAKPGGMLTYGIPSFRLEKDVVDAEIDVLRELGVEFRMGVDVGRDVTIEELKAQGYNGFYIGTGLQSAGKMGIPGEDAEGVCAGIDLVRRIAAGEDVKMSGKVVVIGGGNIGSDIARTIVRCGADEVHLYCLEAYDDMPMGPEDRELCEEEGIKIHAGWGQTDVTSKGGKVTGINFRKCLSVRDAKGKFNPEFDDNVTEHADCTAVVYCIGQKPDHGSLFKGTGVKFNKNGTIKADPFTYQTDDPDIFVGGDVFTGQKFVIDAVAAGKQGAISLHRHVLEGHSLTAGRDRLEFKAIDKDNIDFDAVESGESYDNTPRQVPGKKEGALSFADNRLTFTEAQVKAETARCLGCGASHVDENRCLGCGVCTTRCKFDAIHLHKRTDVASLPYKDRFLEMPRFRQQRAEKIRIRKASEK